jgi:hypothetical protein
MKKGTSAVRRALFYVGEVRLAETYLFKTFQGPRMQSPSKFRTEADQAKNSFAEDPYIDLRPFGPLAAIKTSY